MKVCILFYGINRSIQYTYGSIETHILDVLKQNKIEYDIYVHTYSFKTSVTFQRARESNIRIDHKPLINTLNPTRYQVDDDDDITERLNLPQYRSKPDIFHDNYQSVNNYVKGLYSLKQAYLLSGGGYPVYLVVRPDLQYTAPLSIDELRDCFHDRNVIYTPSFDMWGGFNDRFAFGGCDIMKTYCNRLDGFLEYSKVKYAHSESYLKHVLKTTKHTKMVCKRIRHNGMCVD